MGNMRVFRRILLILALLALAHGSAQAQALGQIFGKVTDTTGGVLPGVTVTVSGTGLQQPLTAVTTTTGAYSFPNVPIGTYTVTFELSGFKKVVRPGVELVTGFSAMIDMKMEVGAVSQEVNVSAVSPVVDTKKTTTGGTFTADVIQKIPTARDPWQIIKMAPAVNVSGVNVGGSASGQQPTLSVFGTSSNVQWNFEGGNITDMSSNSSPSYFNFDSFQEIQVVTGGGDVSVQSAGLFINLVTKSGSNVFKGTGTVTFANHDLQAQNVSEALFNAGGSNGTGLSGNPMHRVAVYDAEVGGPIKRNRLWYWASVDHQDINVGVSNFFDTSKASCVPPPSTFARLSEVQGCLKNDKTVIRDYNAKVNYQLNSGNKFQFLYVTDNKVRNARGASATTAIEAVTQQYSKGGEFADPMYQLTHTLVLTDKLVFTNQMTYLAGGFFLDNQDFKRCGSTTREVGNSNSITDPTCMFNIQPLVNRTTSYQSRGLNGGTYQTERPSWEVKTDGNYFVSHLLGGDHQLKFGVGWRKNPVMTYSHWGGGAVARLECVGNASANCGDGKEVAVGSSPTGVVNYQATLFRDILVNNTWWTYSSYFQDSYSRGRIRINGGVRQDYQNSKFLGGCVPANVLRPDLLPQQCQGEADPHQSFNNLSPRVSATYDLRGNGKTSVHASYSYYFQSRITLANGLSNLGGVSLTWGPNQNSGACSTVANSGCWTDLNLDGFVQANELIGTPTASTARFDTATGILSTVAPVIDPNVQIGRTRETITGIDHELMPNMHLAVDYIHRYNDHGSTTYINGYQPGAAGYPISALYTNRQVFTDPITGISAPYYLICDGCTRPTGTNITVTNPQWTTYNGVTIAVGKRLSNKWQLNGSYTWNDFRNHSPTSTIGGDPTGNEFQDGYTNESARFDAKINGSYELPWGIQAAANLNIQENGVRRMTINGPGTVYGGTSGTVSKTTLEFEPRGSDWLNVVKLLDLSGSKTVSIPGTSQKFTLTVDCFNVLNVATIRGYSSNNQSNVPGTYTQVTSIVPPRVFRLGGRITF
jgi:Carboxypeptidase regulatory-like domain